MCFYSYSTYSQFFPITSRSGSLLIVCQSLQNQEFFSGYFKSVPSGMEIALNILVFFFKYDSSVL